MISSKPSTSPIALNLLARSHPLFLFYTLAFALSWIGFAPVLARSHGLPTFSSPLWLGCLALAAASPALAAWITTSLAGDSQTGLHNLRRGFSKPVTPRWFLVALLLPLAILTASELLASIRLPHQSPILPPGTLREILLTTGMSLAANPWEEIGWRGFALNRLQARHSSVIAALIVGALAVLWHTPLLLWPASPMSKFPYVPWALAAIADSFLLAWLYNSTAQSLATVTLFHITLNIFGSIVGVRSHALLAAVEAVIVLAILLTYGPSLTPSGTRTRSPR